MHKRLLGRTPLGGLFAAAISGILCLMLALMPYADAATKNGQHLVTIHDRGEEKSLLTNDATLRQVFADAHIALDKHDLVEPGLDGQLIGKSYQVNVYRARPIVIVDGKNEIKVMSAYRTAKQIVENAGITVHDEDEMSLGLSSDLITDGASLRLTIQRALPVELVLYGEQSTVYTQASTVDDFLKDKSIELGPHDTLSVKKSEVITPDMKVEVWRNGKQTVTRHKAIPFTVEQIQDTDRPVGYKKVTTPGVKGDSLVTYQVIMRNGKELKRKVIQTVVTKKPSKQIEVVGAKPSFGGDFGAALAKLRSCEGGYSSWNPAGPYYGAYQFDRGTWSSVSSAPYGNATPAQQDAAAHELYVRRGWSPWPVCASSLPDTYR